MSVASEITRLQGVKSDIMTALANKGVNVPQGAALADVPGLIEDIPGGGGGGFPEGYTKYDWIKLNENETIGLVGNRYFWLPINNAVNNDGTLFLIEYEVKLNTYGNSLLLTTTNNPGGSLSSGNIELELRRQNDSHGGFHHVNNTNVAWPGDMDLGIVWGHNTMTLQNGIITCNDNEIYNNNNIFQKVSVEGKYITPINGSESSNNQKIYNVQIKRGNAIIYNYFPCTRDSDGVIGFIDIINNVFIRNAEQNENTYYVVGND